MNKRTKKRSTTPAPKWRNPVVSAVTSKAVVANLDRAAKINKRLGRKDLSTRSRVAGRVLELGWPTFLHLHPFDANDEQAA